MLSASDKTSAILVAGVMVAVVIVILWLFFYTEVGLTLKSTGDNSDMSRAQGINVKFNQVLGLVAIFIGLSVSTKIKPNFVVSLIGVIGGGIVYYIIYRLVLFLGLTTDYLKMLSAVIVVIFLAVPYMKSTYFTKQKALNVNNSGGDRNA